MAPQYAPSLRSRLAPLLFVLQTGFIAIYAFYIEIEKNVQTDGNTFNNFYSGELFLRGGGGKAGAYMLLREYLFNRLLHVIYFSVPVLQSTSFSHYVVEKRM